MTKNQYELMAFVCRQHHCNNCIGCPCGDRHCYKYYMQDAVFDFPNRGYDYLNIAERLAVQRKKTLKI